MNHLWQRFLLASSLLVGLAIGIAATVFGYSNLNTVDVRWSVFHLDGVPLWTVAVVPIALILIAGTLYHWVDGLHHFTEHMRHRHRVNELEAEVARLRAHLDHVLEMPREDAKEMAAASEARASLPAADVAGMDREMAAVEPATGPAVEASSAPAAEPEPEPEVAAPVRSPGDNSSNNGNKRQKRPRIVLDKPAETANDNTNGAEKEPAAPAAEA